MAHTTTATAQYKTAEYKKITVLMPWQIKEGIAAATRDLGINNMSATARTLIESALASTSGPIPAIYPPHMGGAELRRWTKAGGLTQAQAADLWGLSPSGFKSRLQNEPQKRRAKVKRTEPLNIVLRVSTIERIQSKMTEGHVNLQEAIRDLLAQQLGLAATLAALEDHLTAIS